MHPSAIPLPTPAYIQGRLQHLAPDLRVENVSDVAAVIAHQLKMAKLSATVGNNRAAIVRFKLQWPRFFHSAPEMELISLSEVPRKAPPSPNPRHRKLNSPDFTPKRKKVPKSYD
jgi:hypothetical protein